ncbi:flagellin [Methanocalculus taiwanensis]|nr:flagellin [Methanocalculus taiwanensis]
MADEDGFSGLEAAIVLIAFVVVAAVFSFVILGSGFSSADKAKEITMDAGRSPTAVMVMGTVVGQANDLGVCLRRVVFSCGLNGEGISASGIRYTLMTNEKIYEVPASDVTLSWVSERETNAFLSEGEIVRVELELIPAAIVSGTEFMLTIAPPRGVPVNIRCRVPETLVANKYYEVGFGG